MLLIILEGIDNCGKNTIATMLVNKYSTITQINFPDYTTPFGQFIKHELRANLSALSLQLLFSSERLSKANIIRSMSASGTIIATRYTYSAFAYGLSRGIDPSLLSLLEKDMPKPDKKIFLKIPFEESMKRSKTPDLFERDVQLLRKVENTYAELIDREKDWDIVDANKDIQEVFADVEKLCFSD